MSKKEKKKQEPVTEETVAEEPVKVEQPEKSAEELLQEEIDKLKHEVEVTKNAYYKAYADMDNLKKRLLNEADQANTYRIQTFTLSILPAIDSLERALSGKSTDDPFVKGVKLTYDQILNALHNEGVTEIDCLNKPFDANFCNALLTEKAEGVEPNTVIEVLQKGYILKDRLLRAALVKVSE